MIPKIIHQIWIGSDSPPLKWMQTWKDKHPTWEYILWDNETIERSLFKNKKAIRYYVDNKLWHGVADIVRYEILYNFGGFVAPADSECLLPIDELLDEVESEGKDCFTCVENDQYPQYIVPLLGATRKNKLAKKASNKIFNRETLPTVPWIDTGNKFFGEFAREYKGLKLFPYYYFVPQHPTAGEYRGKDKIYCKQHWGTTTNSYKEGR